MSLLIFYFCPHFFSILKHFAPGAVLLLLSSHTERKGGSDCAWLQITPRWTARKAVRAPGILAPNKANKQSPICQIQNQGMDLMYQEGVQSCPQDFNVAVPAWRTHCVNLPRQPCVEGFTVVSLLNELRSKATVEN